MTKRGISPLIATVLLVGFTIAIAGVVSTFLIKETKEGFKPELIIKDTELCDSVGIGYMLVSNTGKCEDDGTVITNFYLTNKGAFTIKKITVRTPKGSGNATIEIKPQQKLKQSIIKPSGSTFLVDIVPWIQDHTVQDKTVLIICNTKTLNIDLAKICSQ